MATILVAADGGWIRDLVKSAFVGPGQKVLEVTRGRQAAMDKEMAALKAKAPE